MKAKIIKIGNSRGVRIPKEIIEDVGLEDEVLLEATRHSVVIRPSRKIRAGWADEFIRMAKNGDDQLLEADIHPSAWDSEEWTWK